MIRFRMYRLLLLVMIGFLGLTGSSQAQSALDFNMMQAQQAYQSGDYKAAVTYSEQVLKKDSLRLKAYILKSNSHLALQQPTLAESTAGEGLRRYPDSSLLQWIKAEVHLQQSRLDRALNLYLDLYEANQRANDTTHKDKIARRLGLVYQTKGGRAFRQKDLDEAEFLFKKVRKYIPDSLHSYHNLALVYLQREKWQEALKTISSGLAKFPGNTQLVRMRANALYQTDDYDGVVEQYRALHEQNSGDVETALQYARLLMVQRDQDNAYAIYNELLKNHPHNRKVYESIADIYEQRNDISAKRSLLYKMRKQFPNDHSILEQIARTYETEEKWQQARIVYDTLRTQKKEPSTEIAIARSWEQQDSLLMAQKVYRRATEDYPDNADLLRRKGMVEEKLARYESALQTYKTLLSLDENSDNHIRVGRVQEVLNNLAKALEHYREAIEKGTNEPLPFYGAGRILLSDDYEQAFFWGRRALEYALKKVRVTQQQITTMLNEQDNLFSIKEQGQYGSDLEKYNRLTEEVFLFLTQNFKREKVLPLLKELEDKYPKSARLLFLQSSYYGDIIGNDRKQFELLKQTVELNSGFSEAHIRLGDHYAEGGQTIQAIQSYERALSVDPVKPEPYKALIDLYRRKGQIDQLIERWKARYRVRPKNDALREHLIEALHKAERFEEAQKIINSN